MRVSQLLEVHLGANIGGPWAIWPASSPSYFFSCFLSNSIPPFLEAPISMFMYYKAEEICMRDCKRFFVQWIYTPNSYGHRSNTEQRKYLCLPSLSAFLVLICIHCKSHIGDLWTTAGDPKCYYRDSICIHGPKTTSLLLLYF